MTTPDDLVKLALECGASCLDAKPYVCFHPFALEVFASRIAAQKEQPAPVQQALTDEQIDAVWEGLPGICIHNDAAARGLNTQVMMRRAFARTVLASQAREPEWRTIDSAPKDGTKFLAYRHGRVAEGSCLLREDGEMWSFGNQSGHIDVYPEIRPSHWRPMLAPPHSDAIKEGS